MFLVVLMVFVATANGRSRIIGGSDARRGQFAHMVSLRRYGGGHFCGGSVIHKKWVVTAAHCVGTDPKGYQVIVNDHNSGHLDGEEVIYNVKSIERYPGYTTYKKDDVALLEVDSNIDTEYVIERADKSVDLDNATCIISGWGYTTTSDQAQSVASILQYATGKALSNDECRSIWGRNNINNGHICYSKNNTETGACMGDSGGPMVCGDKLVGVTSWGLATCETHRPSVYTRLPYFQDWVDDVIGA